MKNYPVRFYYEKYEKKNIYFLYTRIKITEIGLQEYTKIIY